MFKYSIARLTLMIEDSSTVKYLKGEDKKRWEAFCKRNAGRNADRLETPSVSGKKNKSILDSIPTE